VFDPLSVILEMIFSAVSTRHSTDFDKTERHYIQEQHRKLNKFINLCPDI